METALFPCCFPNFLILPLLSIIHCCSFVLVPSLYFCPPILLLASCCEGRFQVLPNNNLQIHQVTKADEGVYRCEASVEARGEIDFVDIAVVVNGEIHFELLFGKICNGTVQCMKT